MACPSGPGMVSPSLVDWQCIHELMNVFVSSRMLLHLKCFISVTLVSSNPLWPALPVCKSTRRCSCSKVSCSGIQTVSSLKWIRLSTCFVFVRFWEMRFCCDVLIYWVVSQESDSDNEGVKGAINLVPSFSVWGWSLLPRLNGPASKHVDPYISWSL